MVIVDSTVWIDYFAKRDTPETIWLSEAISYRRLGLIDVILCEVLQGIRDERLVEQTSEDMLLCELFDSGGLALSSAPAANYRFLRKGITIRKTIDCLIATLCIERSFELLHRDKDFDEFENHLGLMVVHQEWGWL